MKTLSVPERATITNMGAELGATSSIIPSDEITKAFMPRMPRERLVRTATRSGRRIRAGLTLTFLPSTFGGDAAHAGMLSPERHREHQG